MFSGKLVADQRVTTPLNYKSLWDSCVVEGDPIASEPYMSTQSSIQSGLVTHLDICIHLVKQI